MRPSRGDALTQSALPHFNGHEDSDSEHISLIDNYMGLAIQNPTKSILTCKWCCCCCVVLLLRNHREFFCNSVMTNLWTHEVLCISIVSLFSIWWTVATTHNITHSLWIGCSMLERRKKNCQKKTTTSNGSN